MPHACCATIGAAVASLLVQMPQGSCGRLSPARLLLLPQTATNRAVEVHDASRLLETQGQILPLSDGMLHQLCKSGELHWNEVQGNGPVGHQIGELTWTLLI